MSNNYLRNIPSIQKISEHKLFKQFSETYSREILINELRILLDNYRDKKSLDSDITLDFIFQDLKLKLDELYEKHPKEIINVSGVILQTNFGRAPLPIQAIKAMERVGSNYSNLEYDLEENMTA